MSLALLLIGYLEIRLHPILNAMATAKVTNTVTQTLDGAIANEISSVGITYGDLGNSSYGRIPFFAPCIGHEKRVCREANP